MDEDALAAVEPEAVAPAIGGSVDDQRVRTSAADRCGPPGHVQNSTSKPASG